MGNEDMAMIERIRNVLINDWDPLEVRNNPNLKDEYDAYIGIIMSAVDSSSSVAEIEEILAKIEENELGLEPDRSRLTDVSLKLLSLKK